jgi:hypothetical protein
MQFAIVMSLVIFISAALLLYQFLSGALIGADEEAPSGWPRRAGRAH